MIIPEIIGLITAVAGAIRGLCTVTVALIELRDDRRRRVGRHRR